MTDKQIQKAGDNSSQFQAQNQSIFVNNGIPEERVHAIVNEECEKVAKTCFLESKLVVEQRLGQFRAEFFGAVANRAQLLTALQEPSCVDALGKAARAATMTDEKRDKELLSELLVKRFESPKDRRVAAGVSKAIDIVEYLTDEELTGLTVFFAVNQYTPVASSISEGLEALDNVFGSLIIGGLPRGGDWIDELDAHGALRVDSLSSLKPIVDYYFEALSGYTACGVKEGSNQEQEALTILAEVGLPNDIFVEHELNPGYKRLKLRFIDDFSDIRLIRYQNDGSQCSYVPSCEQLDAYARVADLCKSNECDAVIKENLEKAIRRYPSISKVCDWWQAIPSASKITGVGKCIADANARRLNPQLPELNNKKSCN